METLMAGAAAAARQASQQWTTDQVAQPAAHLSQVVDNERELSDVERGVVHQLREHITALLQARTDDQFRELLQQRLHAINQLADSMAGAPMSSRAFFRTLERPAAVMGTQWVRAVRHAERYADRVEREVERMDGRSAATPEEVERVRRFQSYRHLFRVGYMGLYLLASMHNATHRAFTPRRAGREAIFTLFREAHRMAYEQARMQSYDWETTPAPFQEFIPEIEGDAPYLAASFASALEALEALAA